MKNRLITLILAAAMAVTVFTGCGSNDIEKNSEIKVHASKSELVSGNFYIKHTDGTFDQVYPGENDDAQKTKVMWYKDDVEKIPYLVRGKGDMLVYYTTEDFTPKFTFERYYDLGYSAGICGMAPDKTGRYQIKVDDMYVYPDSDAEEVINTDTKYVVIDSVGSKKLRRNIDTDAQQTQAGSGTEEDPTDRVSSSLVTKYGTVRGLTKDASYSFLVYSGTVKKTVSLKADVRIMGFADKYDSDSYVADKDDGTLIDIGIPLWFNTGFYSIGGKGMFAYVNGNAYDESTNYNNPNENPDESTKTSVSDEEGNENTQLSSSNYDNYMYVSFDESGYVTVSFVIDNMTEEEKAYMQGFSAAFFLTDEYPANMSYDHVMNGWTAKVNVTAGQVYRIGYSGLPRDYAPRAELKCQGANISVNQ